MLTIIAITLIIMVGWTIWSDTQYLKRFDNEQCILDSVYQLEEMVEDLQYEVEMINKELQITAFDDQGNVKV